MDELSDFCHYLKSEFVDECKKWCLEANRPGLQEQPWGEHAVSGRSYSDHPFGPSEPLLFSPLNVCKSGLKN